MTAKVIISADMCYLNGFAFSQDFQLGPMWSHITHLKGILGQKGTVLSFTNSKILIISIPFVYSTKLKYVPFPSPELN